jgi:phospholipid transport system transporter-binding protein
MKLDVTSITGENAARLLEQGEAAIRAGEATIDLGSVTAVDSAAVALLLAWQRAAAGQGKHLRFVGVPSGIVGLAGLYGVDSLLGVEPAKD